MYWLSTSGLQPQVNELQSGLQNSKPFPYTLFTHLFFNLQSEHNVQNVTLKCLSRILFGYIFKPLVVLDNSTCGCNCNGNIVWSRIYLNDKMCNHSNKYSTMFHNSHQQSSSCTGHSLNEAQVDSSSAQLFSQTRLSLLKEYSRQLIDEGEWE